MGIKLTVRLASAFLLLSAFALEAAPILRLSANSLGPVSVAVGGTIQLPTVFASNSGDGTLNLTATSSVPWITPTVGAGTHCGLFGTPCTPIDFKLNAGSLAKGQYKAVITVSSPNTLDAPQVVAIVIEVGGDVPDSIDLYAAPGSTQASTSFTTNYAIATQITTTSGGSWLTVTQSTGTGLGATADLPNYIWKVSANPAGLAAGTYNGTLTTTGGTSNPFDTKSVPVHFHVTSQPIASAPSALNFSIAQGSAAQASGFQVSNAGSGTLTVSGVTASGNPAWLTTSVDNNFVHVTADPATLAPGSYTTTLAVASNGANGTLNVPVTFDVPASAAPWVAAQGAVVNQVWDSADVVAPGTIIALFGQQFTTTTPVYATAVPLPLELGTTRVLVNGVPAPLYFVNYNQIDFQMPFETATGQAVISVERDGQQGNGTFLKVAANSPKVLRLGIQDYAVALNTDNSLVIPASLGGRPAKAGDTIIIWGTGPGQSTPPLATGAGAPSSEPLARVPTIMVRFGPRVFGSSVVVTPDFAGYAPGLVGSMQINVRIPDNAPKGDAVPLSVEYGPIATPIPSNYTTVALQ
jgi:uncharacterized protein (TIGR03437 family)